MENLGTILAIAGALLFIVSMWMLFGYLYFKKGNLKRGFLLLLVSLIVLAGGIFISIKVAWNNAAEGMAIPQEVIEIIENHNAADATQEEQAKVGNTIFLKINQGDWDKYSDKILSFYTAWQKSLNPQADEATIKADFEKLREKSLSN